MSEVTDILPPPILENLHETETALERLVAELIALLPRHPLVYCNPNLLLLPALQLEVGEIAVVVLPMDDRLILEVILDVTNRGGAKFDLEVLNAHEEDAIVSGLKIASIF